MFLKIIENIEQNFEYYSLEINPTLNQYYRSIKIRFNLVDLVELMTVIIAISYQENFSKPLLSSIK